MMVQVNMDWKKYKDYYHYDEELGLVIHDDAPEEMLESLKINEEQNKRLREKYPDFFEDD